MNFEGLRKVLKGDFYTDDAIKIIYATDASAYREIPAAVAIPKDEEDIRKLIDFANEHRTSLIPRAAGTSLAGQVVGDGIVVDISKHFNKIQKLNLEEGWVKVQPGIVRDELNRVLSEHGVFFAPETSTANRAMIGGMIGNNSCGANSVVFGSTREHLIEVEGYLSDGSKVVFNENTSYKESKGLKGAILQNLNDLLNDQENLNRIEKEFPKATIPRRNTGYALDILAKMHPYRPSGPPLNLCSLIAGSEGTLMFITSAKLKLTPLPKPNNRLVCIHCRSIDESLQANLVALKARPHACELMDHYILEATKRNAEQKENRFFIEGDPQAILVVELVRESEEKVEDDTKHLIRSLSESNLGYSYPVIKGDDIKKVWNLRKAGLGLLSNIPGDAKAVAVIEDTAIDVEELPEYIKEFNQILTRHNLYSVHYAHAGSGELHLRPIIDLKTKEGVALFRTIASEIATLVKKYRGSLSGEHGDGRLRGEFIPQMIGAKNYELLRSIKQTWDPKNIFNPGKIVDTPPMDSFLRFDKDQETKSFDTILDFSRDMGIQRSSELCNGSGDCRKSEMTGGTMCPSYMATRNERDTTRARANILREYMTRSSHPNPFAHEEIKEVMDLCLSCKGCKKECPSNVDMGKLKAEWQYQYFKTHGIPLRTKLVAGYAKSMQMLAYTPWLYNATRNLTKPILGFANNRSIPKMAGRSLRSWFRQKFRPLHLNRKKKVYFFFDEFTNYLDVEIGKKAIMLLDRLGYEVMEVNHPGSGRPYLSKGLLKEARELARKNVTIFYPLINGDHPLLGLEPSAILSFRDEYIDLLRGGEQEQARKIAENTFMIEEFLSKEIDSGSIKAEDLSQEKMKVLVHGHCHQKALSSMTPTMKILKTAMNVEVQMIPSGCCGMAGSFGYEKEHFDVSMQIGELVLFPKVRAANEGTIVLASGTSCRHQIKDGTGKKAKHLVEIL